jgi:CRP/FNR family cyclic AMP-dependent transcriptional regulator
MDAYDRLNAMLQLGDATPFVDRIREIIETINLFEDFDSEDIEIFAGYMRCYRAEPGTEIIAEGETGDFMLLILNGTIEIVRKDSNGYPQRVDITGPGKTLGEMSLIDGQPRFASCMALEMVEFATLNREALSRLITDHPKIGVKLMMELLVLFNQRLRSISARLMDCLEAQRLRIR